MKTKTTLYTAFVAVDHESFRPHEWALSSLIEQIPLSNEFPQVCSVHASVVNVTPHLRAITSTENFVKDSDMHLNPTRELMLNRAATMAQLLKEGFPNSDPQVRQAAISLKSEYHDLRNMMTRINGLWEKHCADNGLPLDHNHNFWDES